MVLFFRKATLTSIIIVLFSTGYVFAQNQNIKFEHITIDDGLSQSAVKCILRDNRGFIWFGTMDGLNCYDGYTITIYKKNIESGLSSNIINTIFEDSDNNLWIGTQNGLNLFNREKGKFAPYRMIEKSKENKNANRIQNIFEDSKRNLWIGTSDGLFQITKDVNSNMSFIHYKHNEYDSTAICSSIINVIYEDFKGNIWIGTENGLSRIVQDNKTYFINYNSNENDLASLSDKRINNIFEDSDNNLWIGTWNGLNRYNINDDSFSRIMLHDNVMDNVSNMEVLHIFEDSRGFLWIGTLNGLYQGAVYGSNEATFVYYKHVDNEEYSLSENHITDIFEDRNGNLWIGTDGKGLNMYDYEKKSFIHFRHSKNSINSLSSDKIKTIYEDINGNLWIGTFDGGISLKYGDNKRFYHIERISDNSISNNSVLSFFKDSKEYIWIGTDGGGLSRMVQNDMHTNTFIHFQHDEGDPKSISSNVVLCIYEDSKDNMWIGTWLRGLNLFDRDNGKFINYQYDDKDKSSLSNSAVWTIFEDSKENLWIGTCGGGLSRMIRDKNDNVSFIHYQHDQNDSTSLIGDVVWDIFEDNRGELWIATLFGLSRMITDKNGNYSFINYQHDENGRNSLSDDNVTTIFEDLKGNMWFGTKSGLSKMAPSDRDKNLFTIYSEKDGLPNGVIHGILEDSWGNLWISTNKGLSKFNPINATFKNYEVRDGLQSNQFNLGACLKNSKGEMFFGGVNGFNVFHPDSLKDNTYIPNVVITDFQVFNKSVSVSDNDSPLKTNITETKEIFLSYKHSVFSFEFAALNYVMPEKNQYAYMMEGFDSEWRYVGSERKATYTNLDPGNYIFRVKASNNDGIWNEEGTFISIIITPPYWKTWWFRTLVFIAIVAGLIISYRIRIRYFKEQRKVLKKMVSERTEELNEVNAMLEEINQEMMQQKEDILAQNEEVKAQRDSIEIQKNELQTLNATKDRFFSIISHDLRGPIGSLYQLGEMLWLKYDAMDTDKRKQLINHVRTVSNNVFSLLENLLHWSKSQLNKIEYEPVKFELAEIVNTTISLLEPQANIKDIKIISKINSNVYAIADKNMITTVIRNLASNAIKFTNPSGMVTISADSNAKFVTIKVSDTGIGIDKDDIERIFKIDESLSTKGTAGEKGTGLGLILCKEFVEKNGGTIKVESEEGKGSVFTFTLPKSELK